MSGKELGGLTLTPGIYGFSGNAEFGPVGATLTFDGQGNLTSLFILQTKSTFISSAYTKVMLTNGAQACNIFYQVGSSATLGAYSAFSGNVVALTSVVVNHGATITGALLATEASIVLDDDSVLAPGQCDDAPDSPTAPPQSPSPDMSLPSPPPPPPPLIELPLPVILGGRRR